MIDAERAVLGACLLGGKGYWNVADLLTAEDFTDPDHAALWKVLGEMGRTGRAMDFIGVGEVDKSLEMLAVEVANETPGGELRARGWAEMLVRRSAERRWRSVRLQIGKLEGPDAAAEAYRLLATCAPKDAAAMKLAREYFRASVAQLQERSQSDRPIVGLPCGIPALDTLTCGWQPGNLIVLAARPSVGKTAIALQFALHAAVDCATPVLFFSQEQSGVELADRITSHLGRVPGDMIRNPTTMEDHYWTGVTRAAELINEAPLYIDESTDLGLDAIAARCRQLNAQHRLGLVVIDYLGLMRMPKADRHDLAVAGVTRGLKALSKDLSIPIILLCQLNREGIGRPTKKDLRDSGAIEQDADVIVFLYRKDDANKEHTTLVLDKQRNGPTGDVELQSNLRLMRFDEYTGSVPAPSSGDKGWKSRGSVAGSRFDDRSAA
jgi:replicative DNA helicase